MKQSAIIFSHAPHGNAKGREALDIALALSDLNKITIIFMQEGIFHLLANQQPNQILMRDYIATFGMLDIYDINHVYVCQEALAKYGLLNTPFIINAQIINQQTIRTLLAKQDSIFKF